MTDFKEKVASIILRVNQHHRLLVAKATHQLQRTNKFVLPKEECPLTSTRHTNLVKLIANEVSAISWYSIKTVKE